MVKRGVSVIKEKVRQQKTFLLVLLLMFVVRGSFADHMRVPSGSMKPNIQVGDHIFVNKLAYRLNLPFTQYGWPLSEPTPGEVVVFQHPEDDITMVKRLIAGPGDQVRVRDGFVSINGEPLNSVGVEVVEEGIAFLQEVNHDTTYRVRRNAERVLRGRQEFTVPPGHYFFLGDNRDNSSDGRDWGLVSEDLLIGRAEGVLFSVVFGDKYLPRMNWQRIGAGLSEGS